MKLPRWLAHLYATAFGFFWIPCPLCGEMFGGQEVREDWEALFVSGKWYIVCKRCIPAARAKTAELMTPGRAA